MKKRWIIVLGLFLTVICIVCFAIFRSRNNIDASYVFNGDYDELKQVAEYLISLENITDATIEEANGTMILRFGDEMRIDDSDICSIISDLFEKGYKEIGKSRADTIYFVRWKNLFGSFKGFAFSIDGSEDLTIPFLVDQKPLPKADWYYYEDDYNEWRESKDDESQANQGTVSVKTV